MSDDVDLRLKLERKTVPLEILIDKKYYTPSYKQLVDYCDRKVYVDCMKK